MPRGLNELFLAWGRCGRKFTTIYCVFRSHRSSCGCRSKAIRHRHILQRRTGNRIAQPFQDSCLHGYARPRIFDFDNPLDRLRELPNPGGGLILCGESIVGKVICEFHSPGPRLDGRIFCIGRLAWMDFGFTVSLIDARQRSDLRLSAYCFPDLGRATAYVATLAIGARIMTVLPLLRRRYSNGRHPAEERLTLEVE